MLLLEEIVSRNYFLSLGLVRGRVSVSVILRVIKNIDFWSKMSSKNRKRALFDRL